MPAASRLKRCGFAPERASHSSKPCNRGARMATLYISPTGSGLGDGSSIENAGTLANLNKFIAAAGPGGEVLLIADQGTYQRGTQLSITAGGTADAPVTIRGIDSNGNPMAAAINGTRAPD